MGHTCTEILLFIGEIIFDLLKSGSSRLLEQEKESDVKTKLVPTGPRQLRLG